MVYIYIVSIAKPLKYDITLHLKFKTTTELHSSIFKRKKTQKTPYFSILNKIKPQLYLLFAFSIK